MSRVHRSAFLAAFVALAVLPVWAVRAPVSEAFLDWLDDGAPTDGFVPSPVDTSHLPAAYRAQAARRAGERRPALRASSGSALPARWSSVEKGWVTPVRNQLSSNTCWAHAALACIETATLKETACTVTNVFSVNHLSRHDVGFCWGYEDGGNGQMAEAMLTSWRDPLNEAQDPFPNEEGTCVGPPAVCHVQNTVCLPQRTGATDNETLKRAVMDYGAVFVSYDASLGIYKWQTGSYYCSNLSAAPNHAVELVGWDDDYPTNNFAKSSIPPGKGAFLVKNSWGTEPYNSTTNGYNWISYYDVSFVTFSDSAYAFPAPERATNYGRVYQYDPCGYISSYNSLDEGDDERLPYTNWCANVFTAVATGVVEAAGFYSVSPGTEYTLRVYNSLVGSDPATGSLVSEQTGTVSVAGFVTVPLATPVPITLSGERFAVAVALTSPGTDFPIPVEMSVFGYSDCTANAGESFYSKDGARWKDFQHFDKTANVCIKAYTRFGADGPLAVPLIAAVSPSPSQVLLRAGEAAEFSVETMPDVPASSIVSWVLDGVVVAQGSTFSFDAAADDHGTLALVCQVWSADGVDSRSWLVSVANDVRVSDDEALAAAIAGAVPGDRILVAPGEYVGQLDGPTVPVEIIGEEGPEKTLLVRKNGYCCYNGYSCEDTVLAGFTLIGGNCSTGGGACYGVISNCVITGCEADYGGGAYGCFVVDCVISNCVAYWGGGAADAYVLNSLVVENSAENLNWREGGFGGGAFECILDGSTLAGNWAARYGGGAYLHQYGTACNTIVATNICGRGFANGHDVYGNAYWTMVASISDQDAKFADPAHGDWHLAPNSPAIDAGMNECATSWTDLDGAARIFGSRVDIGCYEFSHVPQGWTKPDVAAGATTTQEAAAVAAALVTDGFAPDVAAHVTTLSAFHRLTAWAEAKEVAPAALAASSAPLLASALDAAGPLEIAPEDIDPFSIALSTSPTGAVLAKIMLSFAAYEAVRCDPMLLKAAVGVLCAPSPSGPFSADGISSVAEPRSDGIELTVTTSDGAPALFFKPTVR